METTTGTADLSPACEGADAAAPGTDRPKRLPLPRAAVRGRIYWRYAVPIVLVHLLALGALVPGLFSVTGLVLFAVGVPLFGQGINLAYHRLLSHRSFKVPRPLERALVVGTLCSLQDTPARWVATHRFHHSHSDEPDDPHSPLVAFLWAHVGWLLVWNPQVHGLANYDKYARDILEDPFYMRLEKGWLWAWIYVAHAAAYFAAGVAGVLIGGGGAAAAVQFGLSLLVWGVFLRTVAVWHITWSVNSLTHLFGYRSYDTGENSRNNWLVGLLAAGEGWHNNHHHDPASASNRHRWWEVDVTYAVIRVLAWLGLARDIVPPRHERQALEQARRIPR
jgi:stearoyl-CoA desaturase (delta-9 desaturase)